MTYSTKLWIQGSMGLTGLCIALAGCGDDPGASASASESSSASISATNATMTGPSGGESESATESAGSISGSATEATTVSTGTESETNASATDSSGDTGELGFCGDEPPKGYVGPFDACETEPKTGTFEPVVEWSQKTWTVAPTSNQVVMAPIVATITDDDGDGVYGSAGDMPAILFVSYAGTAVLGEGVLRALSGDGSKELLAITGEKISGITGLAVGDLDGDDRPEIVAILLNSAIAAFEHDGTLKWTSAAYPSDIAQMRPTMSAPAIADLDADGKPEVIVGRVILNNDGTLRGKGMYGMGSSLQFGSTSFAADLDGDGQQEVIAGNAVYRADGSDVWSLPETDGYPAVADFDDDGTPEIVVVGDGTLRLQSATGKVLWNVVNPGGVGGPPTIADFDGDGAPEIGVAGKIAYVVFDTDGTVLWQQPTQDASSAVTGSSVYDFEGDGVADVVYADEINLYVYSGIDGAVKLLWDGHDNGTGIEYPIVVDVDNDGQVEIVVVHNQLIGGTSAGITVLGDADKSWRPGRKVWNQHAYNITNVNDDGTIPKVPEANWLKYNNFRSGDLSSADGLAAPDLVMVSPENCENECVGASSINIWVQLGNTGAIALTGGVTIEVYGTSKGDESLIKEVPVDIVLQPGEYADAISIEVDTTDLEEIRVAAVSNEPECNDDETNEIILTSPFCSIAQ